MSIDDLNFSIFSAKMDMYEKTKWTFECLYAPRSCINTWMMSIIYLALCMC